MRAVAALAGLLAVGHAAAQDDSPDRWSAGSWLSVGTGYETEAGFSADPARTEIPGGAFLNVAPALSVRGDPARHWAVRLAAKGSFEQQSGDDRRLLAGLSTWAELRLRSRNRLYGTIAVGAEYFDDSEIDTLRRTAGTVRLGLGLDGSRWGGELGAGARDTRYANLMTENDEGLPGTYTESTGELRLSGWARVGTRWLVTGEIGRLSNDARDPAFDANSWLARLAARAPAGRRWSLWLSGTYQQRDFTKRPPAEDDDDYLQVGFRIARPWGGRHEVGLAISHLRYRDPAHLSEDSSRVGLIYRRSFGIPTAETAPARGLTAAERAASDPIVDGGTVRFRLLAPDAERVQLAGDFNGWAPEETNLRRRDGGWWELDLALPPGSYQFVYVVDGRWQAPLPNATTIRDGFGGHNGLFVVPEP